MEERYLGVLSCVAYTYFNDLCIFEQVFHLVKYC